MIFYYSATGNTRFCADSLAESLHEELLDILSLSQADLSLKEVRSVGFIFPIYCWGIPPVMKKFMEEVFPKIPEDCYVWTVCTCGDEAGTAMRQVDKLLIRMRGRGVDATYSVIMPNTYVLLPGFDVDKPEIEKEKLRLAPLRISEIANSLKTRTRGVYEVKEGSVPALRSAIYPLFIKWGVNPKKWYASDACVGCGKCEKICPARNISMVESRPRWASRCFSCCGCFHVCPVHAVNYGSITRHKSQYLFPNLKL